MVELVLHEHLTIIYPVDVESYTLSRPTANPIPERGMHECACEPERLIKLIAHDSTITAPIGWS